jgi:DNA-binding transcriptional regulator YiaG
VLVKKISPLRIAEARELFRSGRVREIREAARVSQQAMAQAIGVDRSAWSHWEAGRREPSETHAVRALDLLDVLAERYARVS